MVARAVAATVRAIAPVAATVTRSPTRPHPPSGRRPITRRAVCRPVAQPRTARQRAPRPAVRPPLVLRTAPSHRIRRLRSRRRSARSTRRATPSCNSRTAIATTYPASRKHDRIFLVLRHKPTASVRRCHGIGVPVFLRCSKPRAAPATAAFSMSSCCVRQHGIT